jgi:hypothetical protein
MPRFHLFGDTRLSAEASGFFQWFMLDRVEMEAPAPGQRAAHYRPNGPAFHNQTELVISTDDGDTLLALELRLARGFIDHDDHGLFARDITKSILRDSIDGAGADAMQLDTLMNQVEFPATVRGPHVTARSAEARGPNAPTMGYEVYLGLRGRWEHRGASFTLVFENYVRDTAPWFRLSSTAR